MTLTENKVSYNGLSIIKMKAAIYYITGNDEAVNQFEKYIDVLKDRKGKYASLKKLFLDAYKEKYNALSDAEMIEIDGIVKKYEETEKATKAA